MPATIVDQDNDVVGPYNRLSASQVNSFQSCPRLWFYEKNLHFKFPQVPVLFVGRAVEFLDSVSIREALTMAKIQPSTVIVSLEDNILPHSTLIKSDITLKVTTVSSGG